MSEVAALYRVQEFELDIIDRAKRIKAINAQLDDDAELQQAVVVHDAAQVVYDEAEKRVKDLELEIATVVEKRESAESRLYSGEVTHPKELQDMQLEVEAHTRRRSALNDELVKVSAERDERRQQLSDSEGDLNQEQDQREQVSQELKTEKDKLTAAVNELLVQRKSAIAEIPADTFKIYNKMRAPKSNRPVAVLREKACTICGIEQNSIVITAINRSKGMVNCQNCGRILIRL